MSPNSAGDRRPVGIAINVGANSTLPGIRGRIWPSGAFEYIPIPEREPTGTWVPTYGDLDVEVPADLEAVPVHLDPSFDEYPHCVGYTYGDEHPVKAGPLSTLRAGDFLWFYASLEPTEGGPTWAPSRWGAFVIGQFRLAVDAFDPRDSTDLPEHLRRQCSSNAHAKRVEPDARTIIIGDPVESMLFDRAIPLSAPSAGTDANAFVTDLAGDSGRGPWWRRVLRFDADAAEAFIGAIENGMRQPDGTW